MATSLVPDPLQLWRDALTRLESDVNAAATGSLQSQEVLRALHQFSSMSLGMQQLFEKVVGTYLRKANLPSRKDVVELGESLRRIEEKLDRLLPPDAAAEAPRPARTRRPPSAATASAAEPATSAELPAAPPSPAERKAPRRGPAKATRRTRAR